MLDLHSAKSSSNSLHVDNSQSGLLDEILESAASSKSFFGSNQKHRQYLAVPTGDSLKSLILVDTPDTNQM